MAPPIGPFSNPNDIRWSWVGIGEHRGNGTRVHYGQAKVIRLSDGKERMFSVGDVVQIRSPEKLWIAHLVGMFEKNPVHSFAERKAVRTHTADGDGQAGPVGKAGGQDKMLCNLRWFFDMDDVEERSLAQCPWFKPSPEELFFSDFVNSYPHTLDVIEGKVFISETFAEQVRKTRFPPKEAWSGDYFRVVRHFISSRGNPPMIREIKYNELKMLLRWPCVDKNLFSGNEEDKSRVKPAVKQVVRQRDW